MAGHHLIAIATTQWPHSPTTEARPQLAQALAGIVKLFTQTLGSYQRHLEAQSENPASRDLGDRLDEWFADDAREASDWVVLYYTGHAELLDESLYLLTSDYKDGRLPTTTLALADLARYVRAPRGAGRPRSIRNVLMIVDTCFAGAGTQELVEKFAQAFRRSPGGSFYLLGAALSRQEAVAGALSAALIQAVEELSRRHVAQPWLYFEQIVPMVNRLLAKRGVQNAIWSGVSSLEEEPQFFPNPSHVDIADAAVPVNEAWRAINEAEFRAHWEPRSRGVEFSDQQGQYFTGRRAALDRLDGFLESADDRRTRVVTGKPGAGKSAILSQLVVRSRKQTAKVDLAIHAKGKSLDDIAGRFSELVGSKPDAESVIEQLGKSEGSYHVVVDALDEASEPDIIAERLLKPMSGIDTVKLVVGTREQHANALDGGDVIDIDDPDYASEDDIADYVEARLLRANEPPPRRTPYEGHHALARQVAVAVARKAYPNFFVARLVVEGLLSRRRVVDPASPKDMAFPSQVEDAFKEWLAHFGDDETRVRDLFLPLAYAEGAGLPWDETWAPLASALSGRPYDDDDIEWLRQHAGAFVLEVLDNGRSVYRLYHQALADTLRLDQDDMRIDKVFVEALTATVPRRDDAEGPDWLRASSYVRTHLATHAARAGLLVPLLEQPLYLLAAESSRLLKATAALQEARRLVSMYRSCVHRLSHEPANVAVSYLRLAALRHGLPAFADAVAALPFDRPWDVQWVRGQRTWPRRTFVFDDKRITEIANAEWGSDRPIALVGREDGSILVFDLARETVITKWSVDHGGVRHLAWATTADGPAVVAAWDDNTLGVLWLQSGRSTFRAETGVTALCTAERTGEPVCISAHADHRLVIRRLSDFETVCEGRCEPSKIFGLCQVPLQGANVLAATGDTLRTSVDSSADIEGHDPSDAGASVLRLWSLEDLSLVWECEPEDYGWATYVEPCHLLGHDLLFLANGNMRSSRIFDLKTLTPCFESEAFVERLWLTSRTGRLMLLEVTGNQLRATWLRWEESTGRFVVDDLAGVAEIEATQFARLIGLHLRETLISSTLGRLYAWDVDDLVSGPETRERLDDCVGLLGVSAGSSQSIFSFWQSNAIVIDPTSGKTAAAFALDSYSLNLSALTGVAGRPGVAVGCGRGRLCRLELAHQSEVAAIPVGDASGPVRVVDWNGRLLAFVAAKKARAWHVSIWDLDAEAEILTSGAYGLDMGEEDKVLGALTVAEDAGTLRFAFASTYGKVMTAVFNGPIETPRGFPRAYRELYFVEGGNTYVGALASTSTPEHALCLLAGGTENGKLEIWHFADGDSRAATSVHGVKFTALEFGHLGGRTVLVSASTDRMVRLWTDTLEPLAAIDIGEQVHTLAWLGDSALVVHDQRGSVQRLQFDASKILPTG